MTEDTPNAESAQDDKVHAISGLHGDHYRKATPVQRRLDHVVAKLSHPALLIVLVSGTVLWILVNTVIGWAGGVAFDPPPFALLQVFASVAAVYLAALILTTQRREDGLTRHRDQLTLELTILVERKCAKIIALIEESRFDNPIVKNRVDAVADAMSSPSDAVAVLNAIEEVHRLVDSEKG